MGLGFERVETGGARVVVLRMAGSIDSTDLGRADGAFDRLLAEGVVRFVADLSGLHFLSSSLLGLLVRFGSRARDRGGDLVFTRPPPFAGRVLATLGLDRRFTIVDTAADGVRRLVAGEPTAEHGDVRFTLVPPSEPPLSSPLPRGRIKQVGETWLTFLCRVPSAERADPLALTADNAASELHPGRAIDVSMVAFGPAPKLRMRGQIAGVRYADAGDGDLEAWVSVRPDEAHRGAYEAWAALVIRGGRGGPDTLGAGVPRPRPPRDSPPSSASLN